MKNFIKTIGYLTILVLCASCSYQKNIELPLSPVYQYFDEKEGALSRYLDLLEEAKKEGKISEGQYEIYIMEVEAMQNLILHLKETQSAR